MKKIEEFSRKVKDWEKFRTDAISEMFEGVDECGIYPTTEFFKKLDAKYVDALNWDYKE